MTEHALTGACNLNKTLGVAPPFLRLCYRSVRSLILPSPPNLPGRLAYLNLVRVNRDEALQKSDPRR